MSGSSRPYLRFALISTFVAVVLAAGWTLLGLRAVAANEEQGAAQATARAAAEPLARSLEGINLAQPVPDEALAATDLLAGALVGGDVRGIRITDADGATLYQSGVAAAGRGAPANAEGVSHRRERAADGSELFITTLHAGDQAVEVAQDAGPIDDVIQSAQRELLFAAGVFALTAILMIQGAFWFGIRTFSLEHGRLRYLYNAGQELRDSLDLPDVFSRLACDATKLAGARYGLVALYDPDSSELILRAAYDASTGAVTLHQRVIDEWFMRRSLATKLTVTSDDASGYRQYFGAEAPIDRETPLVCAPMCVRDRSVGVVAVVAPVRGGSSFEATEVRLVEQLAAQAVTAIEQAQLFEKVRNDAAELERSYDSTLKALMAALDAKDEVTEGHCERVARLTLQLAKQMGMPDEMLVHVERGALLHDVGKIGVPDAILKKPRALTDSEWEAMRKHPLLAGLMVSKVGFLEPAMPILLYHHERFDGQGYPFGLAGEHIPLEARIFSIIDAYDAMTSDRPYRPAMGHDDAMEELREHSGAQFDPAVVVAFEALMASRADLREQAPHRLGAEHDHALESEEPAA